MRVVVDSQARRKGEKMGFLMFTAVCVFLAWIYQPKPYTPDPPQSSVFSSTVFSLRRRTQRGVQKNQGMPPLDSAMLADLMRASLESGHSIPGALSAVDYALAEEQEPLGLKRTASLLLLGGSWEEAWEHVPSRANKMKDALYPAWQRGSSPMPLLERAAKSIRGRRSEETRAAAARLSSHVTLPLGFNFLPAFICWGIIPLIFSTAQEGFYG